MRLFNNSPHRIRPGESGLFQYYLTMAKVITDSYTTKLVAKNDHHNRPHDLK